MAITVAFKPIFLVSLLLLLLCFPLPKMEAMKVEMPKATTTASSSRKLLDNTAVGVVAQDADKTLSNTVSAVESIDYTMSTAAVGVVAQDADKTLSNTVSAVGSIDHTVSTAAVGVVAQDADKTLSNTVSAVGSIGYTVSTAVGSDVVSATNTVTG